VVPTVSCNQAFTAKKIVVIMVGAESKRVAHHHWQASDTKVHIPCRLATILIKTGSINQLAWPAEDVNM
jgi:hypothetical protein